MSVPDSGTLLIITAGNPFRADDGVGPYIARELHAARGGVRVMNAGEHPENIIDDAISSKPVRTVIIDAARFGGKPGEARILSAPMIEQRTLSTHIFPLPVVARIIESDTGSPVFFLGIQPAEDNFAEGLSAPVERTAREIIDALMLM